MTPLNARPLGPRQMQDLMSRLGPLLSHPALELATFVLHL